MAEDKPRVDITQAKDEVTRRELLRRAGLGGVVLVYGGLGAKTAVAGAPKFRNKQLQGTLRILQWSHFVPAFDRWFDGVYTKRWGQANDTEVIVDHINQADLPARVAAEAAARRGHDMVATLAPLPQYEDVAINHNEIVQTVRRRRGKMARVAFLSSYNPRTRRYFGFPDNYAPDPVNYRTDLWGQIGRRPTTWANVLAAAPRLKQMNNPVGLGMSNEIDSNMFLLALMMCYGSFVQNRRHRVTINSRQTVNVLRFARQLYQRGMTSEIFAWTAASNNQAMLAGRLSMALNAISITRSAELQNPDLARRISILPIPAGPRGRFGLEHVMHTYMIWRFAQNQRAAKKFLADFEIQYTGAFENSRFYNFPSFPGAVRNVRRRLERDTNIPRNKYVILDRISRQYTYNVGYPGFANAAVGEMFDTYLIPQMFAEVAQGRRTPADAARTYQARMGTIFNKWRRRGKI